MAQTEPPRESPLSMWPLLLKLPFSYRARLLWRLKRHNRRLMHLLHPDLQPEVRRTILLEAALLGQIGKATDELNNRDIDDLFDSAFRDSPGYRSMLTGGWLQLRDWFKEMGGMQKLIDKALSVLNRSLGGPG